MNRRLQLLGLALVVALALTYFWRDGAQKPTDPHLPAGATGDLPGDVIQLTPVSVADQLAHQQDVIHLSLYDDRLEPAVINVKAGDQVKLHVVNYGERSHNLVIPDFHLVGRELAQGEENYVEFHAPEAGEFALYAEHAGEVEISGRLIVEP